MIKEALKYLVELGNPDLVEVDDRKYTAVGLRGIECPEPTRLVVHTLIGLIDYIENQKDMPWELQRELQRELQPEQKDKSDGDDMNYGNHILPLIHVVNPSRVELYSWLQKPWMQRHNYLSVEAFEFNQFRFGNWYDHEQFVIELQSKFVQNDESAKILRVIGNITDEVVKIVQDDGISQEVHTKSGIRRQETIVPNPIILRPFRTFPEIEQPEGKFVLRIKSGNPGDLPAIALFDADNGQWRLQAVQSIKEWILFKVNGFTVIA